jgi:hypothetical protein
VHLLVCNVSEEKKSSFILRIYNFPVAVIGFHLFDFSISQTIHGFEPPVDNKRATACTVLAGLINNGEKALAGSLLPVCCCHE